MEVANFRAYSLQTNQNQSQHPTITFLREEINYHFLCT